MRVLALVLLAAVAAPAEKLGYHEVKTDASGKILPWDTYDRVIQLVFKFWVNLRKCPNGVPYYLQHQVWKPDVEDPRGLGGDQINMALSSWNLLYGYLGDRAVRDNMILMADYWLEHGMSKPDLRWGSLPYPYNTELHSGVYDGDMRAGKGFLQPDKAANFGYELVNLYKMTGTRRYLDAAVRIANTLAARVEAGDEDHSPWPYRVHAATGEVHKEVKNGKTYAASYTSNWTGALLLFDSLDGLGEGERQSYAKARATVVNWLKAYPLRTNKWGPFFEDIPTSAWSDTETNADTLAMYILEHPEWDASWKQQAKSAIDWSFKTFANGEFLKWGVTPINEQTAYRVPGNSHTAHHASLELLYCEKTGDCATKAEAIRRLNWATYMVDDDGKNRYPRDDNWLTDGYGDYVRYYLRSMASAPELAPEDKNRLLRTTSVIQSITYAPDRIRYTKFDARSVEEFKMGAWQPRKAVGAKVEWDAARKLARVRASGRVVVLSR